jgi:hypothetical protein
VKLHIGVAEVEDALSIASLDGPEDLQHHLDDKEPVGRRLRRRNRFLGGGSGVSYRLPSRARSAARQRYQAAVVRYGRQRSPKRRIFRGVGRARDP